MGRVLPFQCVCAYPWMHRRSFLFILRFEGEFTGMRLSSSISHRFENDTKQISKWFGLQWANCVQANCSSKFPCHMLCFTNDCKECCKLEVAFVTQRMEKIPVGKPFHLFEMRKIEFREKSCSRSFACRCWKLKATGTNSTELNWADIANTNGIYSPLCILFNISVCDDNHFGCQFDFHFSREYIAFLWSRKCDSPKTWN